MKGYMVDICSQSSHFSCLEIKKDPGINFIKIDQTKSSLPIKLGDSSWFPSPSIPIETRRTCSENPSIVYFWRNWGMFCSCEIYLISAPMYNCLPYVEKIIRQNEYHWSWLMYIYSSDFPYMFVSSIIKPSSINTNYNLRIWKENCYIQNIVFFI